MCMREEKTLFMSSSQVLLGKKKTGSCECLNYKPMDREHIPQHELWQWQYNTKESFQTTTMS